MYAASYRSPPDRRRRAVSLALTIAAHVLIALLLLLLPNSPLTRMGPSSALTTFDVSSSGSPSPAQTKARERSAAPRGGAPAVQPTPVPQPPQDTPVPPPPPEAVPNNMLIMSRSAFAATDVGKIKGRKDAVQLAAAGDAAGDSGDAGSGSDTPGAGTGPGGQRLYAAEWYREPTASQTGPYLPKEIRDGSWAEIACRTAADFRVEDCQTIGESPVGSRLAYGLRQAAWQFRVRPPRVGGKAMIGTWVRIHYDFTERAGR